jgi:DNA-binding MarR family transcriptional regulator/GNAT superfamily N-acetyltransferase
MYAGASGAGGARVRMLPRMASGPSALERHAAAVRGFNRFYTQRIGVLREHLLDSRFPLAAVRVLYELAHWRGQALPTAAVLARKLALDRGYLSRILRGFEQRRLVSKTRHSADARRKCLALTGKGRRVLAPLEARSQAEAIAMLERLSPAEQSRLVEAMRTVQRVLDAIGDGTSSKSAALVLRPPQPGDIGWVVQRHGVLYAREYGYDERFEALVAEIASQFIKHFDPQRERCWIAELSGEPVGSVFVARKTRSVAKLRLLLVEPHARGLGIGARLVEECVRFARAAGYHRLTLWTQAELLAARHIYARAGFRRVTAQRHRSFGKRLVAETWELALQTR